MLDRGLWSIRYAIDTCTFMKRPGKLSYTEDFGRTDMGESPTGVPIQKELKIRTREIGRANPYLKSSTESPEIVRTAEQAVAYASCLANSWSLLACVRCNYERERCDVKYFSTSLQRG